METGREEVASRESHPGFPREQDQLEKQGQRRQVRRIQGWSRSDVGRRMGCKDGDQKKAKQERVDSPILSINVTFPKKYNPPD